MPTCVCLCVCINIKIFFLNTSKLIKMDKSEEKLIRQLQESNCLNKNHKCLKCVEMVDKMVKRKRRNDGN
jgi:hypothetical protein